MGDVVNPKTAQLTENLEFISDLARYSESLLTEKFIRKKYGNLDEASWTRLAENEDLISAVELEKLRRVGDGSSKRERAQQHVVRAPDILNGIMSDSSASPKHRIDSAKVLDSLAANGPGQSAPAADRFIIQINLGADSLTFNKSIRPLEPGEIDPDDSGPDVDIGAIAAIANKRKDDGGGEHF